MLPIRRFDDVPVRAGWASGGTPDDPQTIATGLVRTSEYRSRLLPPVPFAQELGDMALAPEYRAQDSLLSEAVLSREEWARSRPARVMA
jgi:hypothetical protein